MMDAVTAIDAAVYAALAGEGVVDAMVYQHVPAPDALAFPHVVLGDIDNIVPIGAAGDPDRRGDLSIYVLTESEERESCTKLAGQVVVALDGMELSTDGFTISLSAQSGTVALDESAQGYNAVLTFGVIALAQ